MTLLPIVERELRIRARRSGTLWLRLGAALISFLIVAGMIVFSAAVLAPGQVGKSMFSILSGLAFTACLFEGVRVTADCLSEEKRQGTLGLLFLTDLRGYDVVLGKFFAVSLGSIYGLLAVLPALAVPITMGGVTGWEFWRMVVVLLGTLFFSLSVGILVSTLSYHERRAWLATLLIVGAATVVPIAAGVVTGGMRSLRGVGSPLVAYFQADETAYAAAGRSFWISAGALILYGACCLALACFLLPSHWQVTTSTPSRRRSAPTVTASGKRLQWRPVYRSPRAEANPLSWLVGHGRDASWGMKWMVSLAGLVALSLWGATGFDIDYAFPLLIVALVLHLLLASWVAVEACVTMSMARDSGLLELLLTTPLNPPQIVRGYQDGLTRFFTRPVLLLVGLELVGLVIFAAMYSVEGRGPEDLIGLLVLVGFVMAVSLLDLVGAGAYGLWMGLVCRKPSQAITKTLLYVVWLPALGSMCCPVLLGAIKNAVFINIGSERLLTRLRPIVTGWYAGEAAPLPEAGVTRQGKKRRELPSVLPPDGKSG